MSALLVALLAVAAADPVGWVVIPKVSAVQGKLATGPLRTKALTSEVAAKAVNDTAVITFDAAFRPDYSTDDPARYVNDPGTAQAASVAPNADIRFVVDAQRALQAVQGGPKSVNWQRALQRASFDRLRLLVGGVTLGVGTAHFDGLVSYPPPRSGFIEAFGPSVTAEIPAWVPKNVASVTCFSVQPSAVFNQLNMAFASADPMDQALFYTHLKGLEAQIGKHFSDDALGTAPRLWTTYGKGADAVSVLAVADVALVRRFLDSYADAMPALLPGAKVERQPIAGHDAVSVTLPSKETFAIAYDKTAIVVAGRAKLLQAHFVTKGRGKPTPLGSSAIAYGVTDEVSEKPATWTMVLTDPGLLFTADVKAR